MMYNCNSVNFYARKLAEPLQNFTFFSVSLKNTGGFIPGDTIYVFR